ncbi:hypothetical protein CYMTET_35087 [Cymbomonas tetramitiformis]|uniref:Uncharacterized protein n=1 Tax=Cymbomonas tetramitiformis TaxID=36881 RepID=A0AAE0F9V2_9CHLO|nr:hypothetical protein CYMTET_35087 [Cymbomonas tetramitiformis]
MSRGNPREGWKGSGETFWHALSEVSDRSCDQDPTHVSRNDIDGWIAGREIAAVAETCGKGRSTNERDAIDQAGEAIDSLLADALRAAAVPLDCVRMDRTPDRDPNTGINLPIAKFRDERDAELTAVSTLRDILRSSYQVGEEPDAGLLAAVTGCEVNPEAGDAAFTRTTGRVNKRKSKEEWDDERTGYL